MDICLHQRFEEYTYGAERLAGGEYFDNLHTVLVCVHCGKEFEDMAAVAEDLRSQLRAFVMDFLTEKED